MTLISRRGQIGAGLTWPVAIIAISIIVLLFVAATFFIATKHEVFDTASFDKALIIDGGGNIRADVFAMQNLISFLDMEIENEAVLLELFQQYNNNVDPSIKELVIAELDSLQYCFKEYGGSDKLIEGFAIVMAGNDAHFQQSSFRTFNDAKGEIGSNFVFRSEAFNSDDDDLTNVAFISYPEGNGIVLSFGFYQSKIKYIDSYGGHPGC